MNVITHSLLPVAAKQAMDLRADELPSYREQLKDWAVLAVFGSLPDLLDPHITLGARCNSYSHAWPCTAAVVLACGLCALLCRKHRAGRLAPWCAAAYALHVVGDIVSGGLDFFQTGNAIGAYWVTPMFWPVADLTFVVAFILLNRAARRRHGLEPSIVRALGERWAAGDDKQTVRELDRSRQPPVS